MECAGGGLIIGGLATVLWSTYKESEELCSHLKARRHSVKGGETTGSPSY